MDYSRFSPAYFCSVKLEWVDVGDTDQFSPACAAAYEAEFEKAKARGSNIKALIITNPHNPLGMELPPQLDIDIRILNVEQDNATRERPC
jgi:aspartate/methionine/tyrosine aminotransferase